MTQQDVNDWQKPWTIDQCRDRYVMGDRLGVRLLSELSGVPYSTLSKAAAAGDWLGQRTKFRASVDVQTFDIISAQIAGETAEMLKVHCGAETDVFEVARQMIGLVRFHAKEIKQQFEDAANADPCDDGGGSEKPKTSVYQLQALCAALNLAQSTLDGSINGQRKAMGLDYADINYAVSSVRRAGLEVVEKDEFEAFKRYLEAQSSTQDSEVAGFAAVEVSTL
jgi:hypothetical protein